ncbi:MAG: hypothetical protein Q8R02_24535 [Hyphomonadaceae bacterium]|nr:hypothetical protein [Hyphomonadaceae bacterium]
MGVAASAGPEQIRRVFGYSLRIVIGVLALWFGVSALLKRSKQASATVPPAGAPPSGA